jgi:C4-type Zn-finger protein
MTNIKRQCPICQQKDIDFHDENVDGDAIAHFGNDRLMCASCGYDASQDQDWIIEEEE